MGKIWYVLRKILKWKPYVPHVSATLTERNKEVRLDVSKWFLSKSEMFFEEKIVWTDEKYFVLKQGPNKSIHKVWAPVNPYIDIECKSQSQKKVMCWIGLVAGRVIGPFWIETSMNQDVYLNLLKDKVWPKLKRLTERNLLWFQQDGATCHTTNQNLSFLNEKFNGRVISNKTSVVWPPNSPDLTPLDFFSEDTVCSMFIECSPSRSKSSNQLLRILVKQWILSLYAKSADLPERDLRCSSWKRVVDLSIKSKPTSQFAVVIISTK